MMKEEIKKAVTKFIERRLFATREIQTMESKPEDLVMVDAFCSLLNQYINSIDALEKEQDENSNTKILTKDIKIPVLQAIRETYINVDMYKDDFNKIDDMTRSLIIFVIDAKIRSMFEIDSKNIEVLKYINLKASIEKKEDISEEYINLLLELIKFYEGKVIEYQEQIGHEVILNVESEEVQLLEVMKDLKKALVRDKLKLTQFSNDNLKEITKLINRYFDLAFDTLKDKAEACSINYFLRGVLRYIIENDKESEYVDLANKYIHYFYCNEHAGFNEDLDGRVEFGYNNFISLSDNNYKTFFIVDKDMKITKAYNEDEDYFLFGRDILFGLIEINGEQYSIPVREVIKDGEVSYHNFSIDCDDLLKYYVETQDNVIEKDNEILVYASLKEMLELENLSEYYQNIYSISDFKEVVDLLIEAKTLSKDDMDKIDEVSEFAASWWTQKILCPSHYAELGDIDLMVRLLAGTLAGKKIKYYTDEMIEKFKILLKLEIRKNLISRHDTYLSVDYHPDYKLSKCAIAAGINDISFPLKTNMHISINEIKVREGYGAPYETIFAREDNKKREL